MKLKPPRRRNRPKRRLRRDMSSNSANRSIDAVAFDLDGLLVNTEQLYFEVGDEQLRRRGHRFTAELRDRMMGRPGAVALQIMIDFHGLTASVEELAVESDEIFSVLLATHLEPMPGAEQLLAALEAIEMPKAICTSSRRAFVERVLAPFDWAGRFEFVLSSEDVTYGKPNPEIYLSAAHRFGVEPSQLLVLEDSQNGCRAAVAAGATAVAVPGDHSRQHDFDGAALVADTLADIRIRELLEIP